MNYTDANVTEPQHEGLGLVPALAALPGGTAGAGTRCKHGEKVQLSNATSWDCVETYVVDAQVYAR
jgi:hypothetical protein